MPIPTFAISTAVYLCTGPHSEGTIIHSNASLGMARTLMLKMSLAVHRYSTQFSETGILRCCCYLTIWVLISYIPTYSEIHLWSILAKNNNRKKTCGIYSISWKSRMGITKACSIALSILPHQKRTCMAPVMRTFTLACVYLLVQSPVLLRNDPREDPRIDPRYAERLAKSLPDGMGSRWALVRCCQRCISEDKPCRCPLCGQMLHNTDRLGRLPA